MGGQTSGVVSLCAHGRSQPVQVSKCGHQLTLSVAD